MNRFFGFVAGALTGALVGATIAILMAPAPGTTVREDFKSRVLQLRDEMQQAAADRRSEMERQLANLRAPQG